MATYKTFIKCIEVEYTEIEAESPEEAEDYIDINFSDSEWII